MAKTLKDELYKRFDNIEDNHLVTQTAFLDSRFKKHAFFNGTKSCSMPEFHTLISLIIVRLK